MTINHSPRDAKAWCDEGVNLDNLGRHEEAIACYDKALALDQRSALAWYNKGGSLHMLGRYEEAIDCYGKTLDLNSRQASAWNNKGSAFQELGQSAEAIECYDKAIDIDQRHINAWYNKGVALTKLGRYTEAIVCYDKALEFDPNEVWVLKNKAGMLTVLHRDEEAIDCYNKVLALNPNEVSVLKSKAAILTRLHRDEEAIDCYDKVLVLNPNEVSVLKSKAAILTRLHRDEEAIDCYDIDAIRSKEKTILNFFPGEERFETEHIILSDTDCYWNSDDDDTGITVPNALMLEFINKSGFHGEEEAAADIRREFVGEDHILPPSFFPGMVARVLDDLPVEYPWRCLTVHIQLTPTEAMKSVIKIAKWCSAHDESETAKKLGIKRGTFVLPERSSAERRIERENTVGPHRDEINLVKKIIYVYEMLENHRNDYVTKEDNLEILASEV